MCPFVYIWILQVRILEWVAFPFSRGSSQPRDWTQVSYTAEKAMAAHSSVLAWRSPRPGEPGGLRSVGSHGVGHGWSAAAAAAAAAPALRTGSSPAELQGEPFTFDSRIWSAGILPHLHWSSETLPVVLVSDKLPAGLPWWLGGKEPTCQCRRYKFSPWVGKIPWRRKWQATRYSCWEIPWRRSLNNSKKPQGRVGVGEGVPSQSTVTTAFL